MPAQWYDWTCAACATEWLERATDAGRGEDIYANREAVVHDIGYTENINPTWGLMDGSGTQLCRVLSGHAQLDTAQGWLSFDEAYETYSQTLGAMSGAAYYHWVGVRGVQGDKLWIANSAPGYKGIWDTLTREEFQRLGSFSCVWVV